MIRPLAELASEPHQQERIASGAQRSEGISTPIDRPHRPHRLKPPIDFPAEPLRTIANKGIMVSTLQRSA